MNYEPQKITQKACPRLSFELWAMISSYLLKKDVKSMRLVSRLLRNAAYFRIERVFLSANPLNIEVLRAIANHDVLRHNVTEIIWDDARFSKGPQKPSHRARYSDAGYSDDEYSENEPENYVREHEYWKYGIPFDDGFSDWIFDAQAYRWWSNVEFHRSLRFMGGFEHHHEKGSYAPTMEEKIPLEECWRIYKDLYRQQRAVLSGNEDEKAFRYGLRRFPALKRVTITPAAHGYLFHPFYSTPMIRSFPQGFVYPIPRTWAMPRSDRQNVPGYRWAYLNEKQKDRFRAFRVVTRILAKEKHKISELLVQSNYLPTGINATILGDSCDESYNLRAFLRSPGLRRLDLPLLFMSSRRELRSFDEWQLRETLAEAKEIEDIRISMVARDVYEHPGAQPDSTPLREILPIEYWHKLRNIELSRLFVNVSDLIAFFSVLPKTIRSIELKDVHFVAQGRNVWYNDLMTKMRKKIETNSLWQNKEIAVQPSLRIIILDPSSRLGEIVYGRGILLGKELEQFLYGKGENPFEEPSVVDLGSGLYKLTFRVRAGFGTIIREFESDNWRSYVHNTALESQDSRDCQDANTRPPFEWNDYQY